MLRCIKIYIYCVLLICLNGGWSSASEIYNSKCIIQTERTINHEFIERPSNKDYPFEINLPRGTLCAPAKDKLESFLNDNPNKWYFRKDPEKPNFQGDKSNSHYLKLFEYGYEATNYYDENYSVIRINTSAFPIEVPMYGSVVFFGQGSKVQAYNPVTAQAHDRERSGKEILTYFPASLEVPLATLAWSKASFWINSNLYSINQPATVASSFSKSKQVTSSKYMYSVYSEDYLTQTTPDNYPRKIFLNYDFFELNSYQKYPKSNYLYIYHLRTPGINLDLTNPAVWEDSGLTTLYKLSLFIKDSDVGVACSKLSHQYEMAQGRVQPITEYIDKIKTIFLEQNRSLSNIMYLYFAESETAIEETINLFDPTKLDLSDGKGSPHAIKNIRESLMGLSVLKRNSCLNSIKASDIKSNIESVKSRVQECRSIKAISEDQYKMLNAFLGAARSDKDYLTLEQQEVIRQIAELGKSNMLDSLAIQARTQKFFEVLVKAGAGNVCLEFMSEDLKGAIGK